MTEWLNQCHFGGCLETLRQMPDGLVQACVTSPPYFGLRDYGHDGQIGLEATPDEFIGKLVEVFREVRRVLRDDGTLWVNIGDSYVGSANNGGKDSKTMVGTQAATGSNLPSKRGEGLKPKDLIGIPWLLAFALRADGWYLRQDIIWHKPNPMPESVRDRCTKAHEYIFLMSKSEKYFFDNGAIKEESVDPIGSAKRYEHSFWENGKHQTGGYSADGAKHTAGLKQFDGTRNRRSVWTVATTPYKGAHFATFPPALIEPCILAGAPAGGVVLDPFFGSGTTGQVAQALGRHYIGCELNPAYKPLQDERTAQPSLLLEAA